MRQQWWETCPRANVFSLICWPSLDLGVNEFAEMNAWWMNKEYCLQTSSISFYELKDIGRAKRLHAGYVYKFLDSVINAVIAWYNVPWINSNHSVSHADLYFSQKKFTRSITHYERLWEGQPFSPFRSSLYHICCWNWPPKGWAQINVSRFRAGEQLSLVTLQSDRTDQSLYPIEEIDRVVFRFFSN